MHHSFADGQTGSGKVWMDVKCVDVKCVDVKCVDVKCVDEGCMDVVEWM